MSETCARCESRLTAGPTWRAADATQRQLWRESGVAEHAGRRLCSTCYKTEYKAGRLGEYPPDRPGLSAELVLEEWRHLAPDPTHITSRQVRSVAPRLGMTETALERALQRAQARGELAA